MRRGVVIGGVALGVVLVGVAATVFLLSSIDAIVKAAVEDLGSQATGTSVTLDKVEISATSGEGALQGLTVANPAGFETPSAFELGRISVAIDIGTVTSDVVVIRKIEITAPRITYEIGDKGNNIDAIKRNVDAFAASFAGKGDGAADAGEGPRLVVDDLIIRGGSVAVSASLLKGRKLTARLPDIRLRDIGKEKGGASPAELVDQVIKAVTAGVGKSVGTLNLDKVLKGVGKEAEGAVKGAADRLGKGLDGAGGAVQKLFGK
jgi:hypothetical protein